MVEESFKKKFFRDLRFSINIFYLPALLITIPMLAAYPLGYADKWIPFIVLWTANAILPYVFSLYKFLSASRKWDDKPSPWVTLLGIWIGGPVSLIAGAYLGFIIGLILAIPTYIVLAVMRKRSEAR